jgi:hypothetical protein
VSTNDFKNGLTVEIDGAPYKVIGAPPRPPPSSAARSPAARPRLRMPLMGLAQPARVGRALATVLGFSGCCAWAPIHPPPPPPPPTTTSIQFNRRAEFLHVKPGKGAAFVRSKLKNCMTGGNLEKTFRAGEVAPRGVQRTPPSWPPAARRRSCCGPAWDRSAAQQTPAALARLRPTGADPRAATTSAAQQRQQ